eukprot:7376524-Prymnesium_polylepis.1
MALAPMHRHDIAGAGGRRGGRQRLREEGRHLRQGRHQDGGEAHAAHGRALWLRPQQGQRAVSSHLPPGRHVAVQDRRGEARICRVVRRQGAAGLQELRQRGRREVDRVFAAAPQARRGERLY